MPERQEGTRKSTRLTARSAEPEEPASGTIDKRVEDKSQITSTPLPSVEEESYQSAEEQNLTEEEKASPEIALSPFILTMAGNGDQNNQLSAVLARLAQLEATDVRNTRGITPDQSAFGGANFQPTGFAAKKVFRPYGIDQDAKNPNYDPKAKRSGVDPGVFKGDKEVFDKWVTKLADKFDDDDNTFKKERSRMAVVNAITEGSANDLLEGRYRSEEMPFRNAAEMIATLEAVYHDNNQGSKAREELRHLKYDPADKNMDIHKFIGRVNSLADKANIAKEDRKMVLYEHIPAYINPQLLGDSKDFLISYESFAGKVADSALAQQRAFEERREKKGFKDNGRDSERKKSRSQRRDHSVSKKTKDNFTAGSSEGTEMADRVKEELKKEGKCFLCRKEGHIAKKCPDKKTIAALLASCDDSSSSESQTFDDSEN